MAHESLNIEVHFGGSWHTAAQLLVHDSSAGIHGRTTFAYRNDYIVQHLDAMGTHDARTVSERFPLLFEAWSHDTWPAFTVDIMPAGAARRWWQTRLSQDGLTNAELDFVLLRDHTLAPIGNLRIATSVEPVDAAIPFSKQEVCQRSTSFLEYAAELGAAIGGATGAGGDAPKVLLAENSRGEVFPDAALPDSDVRKCWFVKWPRGRDTDRDRLVLRTEHIYAHALAQIGLDVCPGELNESEGAKPSLWLPRFDRRVTNDGLERIAVESFYSLAGVVQHGASVSHWRFLEALEQCTRARGQMDSFPEMVKNYVCRDLLDVVLGNSDNHGRNKAVLRGAALTLAPIYDLAPMVMDPEGVVRTTRWAEFERAGQIDWPGICRALGKWVDGEEMWEHLRDFAASILPLPDLLFDAGIDAEVLDFPRVYVGRLPQTLEKWGLR
ncbi:MAG: HipA domain-containing protein [bacterium]